MWLFIKKNLSIDFIMCFLLVVSSGNPIFIYSESVRVLYVFLFIGSFIYSLHKKSGSVKKYFKYAFPFIIVSLFQQALLPDLSVSSQLFSLIRIFIGVAIICSLGREFVITYVKVMVFTAFISLLCLGYNFIVGAIPSIHVTGVSYSIFLYTQLISEYSGLELRNCGMFWEPGAFQGYLNIAIAFALFLQKGVFRNTCLLILTLALITTQSTTGYICFSFILLYYVFKFNQSSTATRIISIFTVLLLVVEAFLRLDFMYDKIIDSAQDTYSAQSRFNDYVRFGKLIKDNFIWGVNTEKYELFTGNGFVFMLLYYGAMVVLYYFICLYRNFKKQYSRGVALFWLGIIIISLQGEGFMFYPLYLAFPMIDLFFDYNVNAPGFDIEGQCFDVLNRV